MSDLRKIQLAQILTAGQLWMVTIVLYFTMLRKLSSQEVYSLLSIFSFAMVLLEYPTGVIGDHFSHRNSILLGYVICALGLFLFAFPGNWYYYLIPALLFALGTSLTSGSDTAFLHATSKDFIKDSSNLQTISLIVSVITVSIGGYLSSYDLRIPFYLTAFLFLSAAGLIFFTKKQPKDNFQGNIFARSTGGIKYVWKNNLLFHLIIVSATIGSFFLSFKWFYNPLFLELHIPVSYWGFIIGFAVLLIALGNHLYRKFSTKNFLLPFLGVILTTFCIGLTSWGALALGALLLSQLIRGYIDNQFNIHINETIAISSRASILSLRSLFVRLFSALYIFGAGFILEKTSFFILMSLTSGILLLFCAFSLAKIIRIRKNENIPLVA